MPVTAPGTQQVPKKLLQPVVVVVVVFRVVIISVIVTPHQILFSM